MEIRSQDSQLWFTNVIEPKLATLRQWIKTKSYDEQEMKKFFREFLSELELVNLDNFTVENQIEDILDGARTLQSEPFQNVEINWKELASIAYLKSPFDRVLFSGYWKYYRPLLQKHVEIKDSSILNAYLITRNLLKLVNYIEEAKSNNPLGLAVNE